MCLKGEPVHLCHLSANRNMSPNKCLFPGLWYCSLLFSLHGCTTFSMFVFYYMIRHIITGISSLVVCHALFLCLGERSSILPVLRMWSLTSVIGTGNVWSGGNGEHLGSLMLKWCHVDLNDYFEYCPISCKSVSILLKCRVNITSTHTLHLCPESFLQLAEANWKISLMHLRLCATMLNVLQNYFL